MNINGEWKGRTQASLEGLAKSLDEIREMVGYNCPAGKEIREELVALEKSVTVHHAQHDICGTYRGIWHGYISPLLSAIVGGVVAWLFAKHSN